jgi:hypothetical protein
METEMSVVLEPSPESLERMRERWWEKPSPLVALQLSVWNPETEKYEARWQVRQEADQCRGLSVIQVVYLRTPTPEERACVDECLSMQSPEARVSVVLSDLLPEPL